MLLARRKKIFAIGAAAARDYFLLRKRDPEKRFWKLAGS